MLLENGADVNGQGRNFETPLEVAARRGDKVIMLLLLNKGATIDSETAELLRVLQIRKSRNRYVTI